MSQHSRSAADERGGLEGASAPPGRAVARAGQRGHPVEGVQRSSLISGAQNLLERDPGRLGGSGSRARDLGQSESTAGEGKLIPLIDLQLPSPPGIAKQAECAETEQDLTGRLGNWRRTGHVTDAGKLTAVAGAVEAGAGAQRVIR